MELEEELRVVGNNLKSLEVSEEKVRFLALHLLYIASFGVVSLTVLCFLLFPLLHLCICFQIRTLPLSLFSRVPILFTWIVLRTHCVPS